MTTIPMADTIGADAKNIPATFPKVAGYDTGSGSIPWTLADWGLFPKSGHVHIDQSPGLASYGIGHSAVADIESGAGTIANLMVQTKLRYAAGARGNVYCSLGDPFNHPASSVLVQVLLGMVNAGLDVSKTDFWLADWNLNETQASALIGHYTVPLAGHGNVSVNVVAVQWASPSSNPNTILPGTNQTLSQANVDLSETAPGWFPYVAPPIPPGSPKAPAPPGQWEDAAVLTGVGLDGKLYQTIYHPATGKWTAPIRV